MIFELKEVETETSVKIADDFHVNQLYMAEFEGERLLGRFVRHTVAEISELTTWNFVWPGKSLMFPQGIPFNSLDKVWAVNELS